MLLGNMLLALVWAALQGQFSLGTLATGYLFGYLILLALVLGGVLQPSRYIGRVHRVVGRHRDGRRAGGRRDDRGGRSGGGPTGLLRPLWDLRRLYRQR